MDTAQSRSGWMVAYALAWAIALGGAGALVATLVFATTDGHGVDDDVAPLIGAPLGVALGAWLAHKTRASRRTHRRLLVCGALLAVVASLAAVAAWSKAHEVKGTGPFAGIGEVLLGLLAAAIAAIAVLLFVAGVCGRFADRARVAHDAT